MSEQSSGESRPGEPKTLNIIMWRSFWKQDGKLVCLTLQEDKDKKLHTFTRSISGKNIKNRMLFPHENIIFYVMKCHFLK